ncbi:hypothetical protein DFS33DRAFT_592979 [Desarmillaria ectypa]|nr:hypothetical protein DFS33DRAFT_592979 [Desarmillaria ectypa]
MSKVQDSNLVASQLSRIPKINKSIFISSYIKDQKSHIKAYASQGHAASPHSSLAPLTQKELGGFDTPILKPRVPQLPKSHIEFPQQKPRKPPPVTNTTDKHAKKPSKSQPKPDSSKKQVYSSSSRKRKAAEVSDTEQQARLKERRERRQAKRAVIRDKESDARSEISDKDPIGCKGKQKKKKNKMPPGLALMHGFSATNIGKNRLTTQLPPMLGVFGRGKASKKAKISAKRTDFRAIQFSEELFLNRPTNSKPMHSARCHSSSPSDNDTDDIRSFKSSPTEKHRNRKKDQKHATRRQKKDTALKIEELSAPEEDSDAEVPSLNFSRKKKALEPEIWDIEKSDFVLPSKSHSPASSPAKVSVVLDARCLHWASNSSKVKDNQHHVSSSPVMSVSKSPLAQVDHNFSSPSLGPSQPASQQERYRHPVALPAVFVPSKYFPSASAPIVPSAPLKINVEPAENPVAYAYTLGSDPQSVVVGCAILDDMIDNAPRDVNLHQYHIPPVLKHHVTSEIIDGDQEQDNLTMDVDGCDEHFLEGDTWRDSREYPVHYRFHHTGNAPDLGKYATDLDLNYQQTLHDDAAFRIEDKGFEMNDVTMDPFVTQGSAGQNHYCMDIYDHADDEEYWDDGHNEELFAVFDGDNQHPPNLCESYDISGNGHLDGFASDFPSFDNVYVENEVGKMDENLAFQAQAPPELMASAETSMDDVDDDSLGDAHNFLEGRELLCGFSEVFSLGFAKIERGPTASAEAQVAKTLRDHWLPQRL